jgi:YbbR domain-containing protein
MMQKPAKPTANRTLWDNAVWFAASMALAFFVWLFATLQSNPVQERVFRTVAIQVAHNPNLIVTEQSRDTAIVTVRAPENIINQLVPDDVSVVADVSAEGPGTYRVNLTPEVSRRASVDTSPRQITITLEELREQLVPVKVVVGQEPPRGFEIIGAPTTSVRQALVRGALSKVQQVTAAVVTLNLSEQRGTLEGNYALTPVDAAGGLVTDVVLEPNVTDVAVEIGLRPGTRELRVVPNFLDETLPDGYALTGIVYNPQYVLVSGPQEVLDSIPGALSTEQIDLTGKTESFQIEIAVRVPYEDVFVVGSSLVRVEVGITALSTSRQFDDIPVRITGLPENYSAMLAPEDVTIILTGPRVELDALTPEDLDVVANLSGLAPGAHRIQPVVAVLQGQITRAEILVLPEEMDVVITAAPTPGPPGG